MPPWIQVDHVNGVWRVTKHGRFYGDFLNEQHASSAGEEAAGVNGSTVVMAPATSRPPGRPSSPEGEEK